MVHLTTQLHNILLAQYSFLSPKRTTVPTYLGQGLELMHGEVREEDDHVVLHPDDQAGVALITAADHTNVIALQIKSEK